MAHVTFYRKYRSKTFSELVGQEHIVQTLSNAIENDRLAHAYIFSGPRGTGKTSTARIFAKSLNCINGPSITPCLKCDNCLKITSGQSVDVLEIDAASHTGVDHMRELNDQVKFMPVECKYKVYIIDEVHMLSTGAFNALLKTLEEPPKNVIFILATTESHKIPATIHSRCQQLHFRLLTNDELVNHLSTVSTQESITIDSPSLHAIARQSSGCMRDALSLLNQVYSFKGNSISLEDVQLLLGAIDSSQIHTFMSSFLSGNESEALNQLKQMIHTGGHVQQLVTQLTEAVQYCIYAKHNILSESDVDEKRRESFISMVESIRLDQLVALLEAFAALETSLRHFPNPGMLVQVKVAVMIQTIILNMPSAAPSVPQSQPPRSVSSPQASQAASPKRPVAQETMSVQALSSQPISKQAAAPVTVDSNNPWPSVLRVIEQEKKALYAILNGSVMLDHTTSPVTVVLGEDYRFPFFLDKLKEDKNNTWLVDKWQTLTGFKSKLEFTFNASKASVNSKSNIPAKTEASSSEAVSAESEAPAVNKDAAKTVNHIVNMFQGKVVS